LPPKNYFAGTPKQKSTSEGVMRKRSYIKERNIKLEAGCNAIIQKGLPLKSKDPGSFNLRVSLGVLSVEKALLDLGASINLIPLTMLKK